MMKKTLVGFLMIGLLAVAASAGTWAYFQDSANGAAKITAGNPDLVAVFPSVGTYQDFGDIYLPHLVPGDSGMMNLGEIQNQGTAGGDLYVTIPTYSGIPTDLHLYACDRYGNALADLSQGGTVKIGSMAAKAGGVNAKFPIYMKFAYTETSNPQTGAGADYNFAVTLSLRTAGTNYGTVNVANDFYKNN